MSDTVTGRVDHTVETDQDLADLAERFGTEVVAAIRQATGTTDPLAPCDVEVDVQVRAREEDS